MLDDTNAVTVMELAHRRQVISANVLTPETLLLTTRGFGVRRCLQRRFGIVFDSARVMSS